MADVPVLVCIEGDLRGQHIAVPEGGLDIGRAPENHVVLQDDGVSRFHAHLLFDNGALWLRDAGSRNGVFVNDARVTQHRALKVGDRVRIGAHVFEVRIEPDSQVPNQPPTPGEPSPAGGDDTTQDDEPPPKPSRRWFWPFS